MICFLMFRLHVYMCVIAVPELKWFLPPPHLL